MPWPDRLPAALRRLYRASAATSERDLEDMSSPPLSLEQDLMARHARRYPAPASRGLGSLLRAHRWALSSGLAAVAAVAACQLPVDYDRSFGATVWCEGGIDPEASHLVHKLADRLQRRTGAEEVNVRVHAVAGAPAVLRIDLWGEGAAAAGDDLLSETAAVEAPWADDCRVEPLVETVHGTLGGRLGRELFDLELLDRDDAEAARAQILERLEARGLTGTAEVEVSDRGDGRREIKIRIEAERP